jgi:hypothetical protein
MGYPGYYPPQQGYPMPPGMGDPSIGFPGMHMPPPPGSMPPGPGPVPPMAMSEDIAEGHSATMTSELGQEEPDGKRMKLGENTMFIPEQDFLAMQTVRSKIYLDNWFFTQTLNRLKNFLFLSKHQSWLTRPNGN